MSAVFKALSDPTRPCVLQLLRCGPVTAGDLDDRSEVSKPTRSAHFAVLPEVGRVPAGNAGKGVIHHLKLSVPEDALLRFVQSFGGAAAAAAAEPPAAGEAIGR